MVVIDLSPFLKSGQAFAKHQSSGTELLSRDFWKVIAKAGVMTGATSFRTVACRPSGPAALDGFRPASSLRTPLSVTGMLGILANLRFKNVIWSPWRKSSDRTVGSNFLPYPSLIPREDLAGSGVGA